MIYEPKPSNNRKHNDRATVRTIDKQHRRTAGNFIVHTIYPRGTQFRTTEFQRQLAEDADAEKAAIDKATAEKAAADKAEADKAKADREAEERKKPVEMWTRQIAEREKHDSPNTRFYFMENDYEMKSLDDTPRYRLPERTRKPKWIEKIVYGPDKKTNLCKGEWELQWVQE